MRRKRAIIVLAVCVLVGIGVVAFWPGEKEPEYNGKKLSEWLMIYNSHNQLEEELPANVAAEAVRRIGTNALPSLVRWLSYNDKGWRRKVRRAIVNTPDFIRSPLEAFFRLPRDWQPDATAVAGFQILGPRAVPAIPELIRLAHDTNHPAICLKAVQSLACIGEEGKSVLWSAPALNSPDPAMRRAATNALMITAPQVFNTNRANNF